MAAKRTIVMNVEDFIVKESVYSCPECSENVIHIYDNICSCCGSTLEWPDERPELTGAQDIKIEGNTAEVLKSDGSGKHKIDISDPENLKLIQWNSLQI